MTILFSGLSSVSDRILFTNRGPIVKKENFIQSGSDLYFVSHNEIKIPSGPFSQDLVGKIIEITGSPSGRNDGRFFIESVKNSTNIVVENSDFDFTDHILTEVSLASLANDLKSNFNSHRIQPDIHGTNDSTNIVVSQNAVDLSTAIILLNEIRTKFSSHIILIGPSPSVHIEPDVVNTVLAAPCTNLQSAIILANQLRARFESHRQSSSYHLKRDSVNRISIARVVPKKGTGVYVGPFSWSLLDPRIGQIADDPSDVSVLVNGVPASIDGVFGALGAVVLSSKPLATDTVSIDYNFLNNPPVQIFGLNQPEFVLNQDKNKGIGGLPNHRYRMRSYLVSPKLFKFGIIKSPFDPYKASWKYKAYERAYTAGLNDPTSLLLNSPVNRVGYPNFETSIFESTLRYDPVVLPQNSSDPWTLQGVGTFTLSPRGDELTITDSSNSSGIDSRPPFFSHKIDISFPNVLSAAFRSRVLSSTFDGVFSGIGFGVVDGAKTALIGFIKTKATNLSSSIAIANDLKTKFENHLVSVGIHMPQDLLNYPTVVKSYDLTSLIILLNNLKLRFNQHISTGPSNVHQNIDITNTFLLPDLQLNVDGVEEAILFLNQLVESYNSHRTQSTVHFNNDSINIVEETKQVGILTNRGHLEFDSSWESYAVDWSKYVTYRIEKNPSGDFSLFFSGDFVPAIVVTSSNLPESSSNPFKIDSVQQVFFGSVGNEPTSSSHWAFIRVNTNPIDSNQIIGSKKVYYAPASVPELDPDFPWIKVGHSGTDLIYAGKLLSDSSASSPLSFVQDFGLLTGTYLGYTRLEPSLKERSTLAIDFTTSIGYWSFGVDNKSAGVFIDDDLYSIHLLFLQASPVPAVLTGTSSEPFPIASGDSLILSFGDNSQRTVSFSTPLVTAVSIAAAINTSLGFTFATVSSGKIVFTSQDTGANAKFTLFGGVALGKLGLAPGTYIGKDSDPEPRFSYFGANLPELDSPNWIPSGDQPSEMLGRTLSIVDSSTTNFKTYTLSDNLVTGSVITPNLDWKLDAKILVDSYEPGDSIDAGSNLRFCGALVNVDEGPGGKNVEFHLSISLGGVPYVNVVSYNTYTGNLDSIAEYSFSWNDRKNHVYNLFTNKLSNLCMFLVDGVLLGSFSYSSLNSSVSGPSTTFGSGSLPTNNSNLSSSTSSVEWESLCVVRDSKLQDPTSPLKRYIGIYKGGDPTVLNSYYLSQVDWSSQHLYRIVRDSFNSVSVYIDNSPIPSISTSYDSLSLPPASSSFFKEITNGRNHISFGSFNPFEISRTIWSSLNYSLGRMTLTDGIVPNNQVTNKGNVIVSPEHLKTKIPHDHFGFKVWSGGTPIDDFLANSEVIGYTQLNDTTPPVPATQDLGIRGGLIRTVTKASSVSTLDFVDQNGFLSDFENDDQNSTSIASANTQSQEDANFVSRSNELRSLYEAHRVSLTQHQASDGVNTIVAPVATDFASSIVLLNDLRTKFNTHSQSVVYHTSSDVLNLIVSPIAIDYASAEVLCTEISNKFLAHAFSSKLHQNNDHLDFVYGPDAVDLYSLIVLVNELASKYNLHRVQSGVHPVNDAINVVVSPVATDFVSARLLAIDFDTNFNFRSVPPLAHRTDTTFHLISDVGNSIVSTVLITSSLEDVISYVNEAKAKFNSHLNQPGVHSTFDITNAVFGPNVNTLEVLNSSLNEFKTLYNQHISDPKYHYVTDPFAISSPNATGLASAILLATEAKSKFNIHIQSSAYHLLQDVNNSVLSSDPTDLNSLLILFQELKSKFDLHRINFGSHGVDDTTNSAILTPVVDLVTSMLVLNDLKVKYLNHLVNQGSHLSNDTINVVTSPNAIDFPTSASLATNIALLFNLHIGSNLYHVAKDSTNPINVVPILTLPDLIAITTSIRSKYNLHLMNIESTVHSHGMNDLENVQTIPTPMRLLVSLGKELKLKFNTHLSRSGVHFHNDSFNVFAGISNYKLTTPESYEYGSIIRFFNSIQSSIVSHFLSTYELLDSTSSIHSVPDYKNVYSTPSSTPEGAISLANSLKSSLNSHNVGSVVHLSSTITSYSSTVPKDPVPNLVSLLNSLLDKMNAHFIRERSHNVVDTGNVLNFEQLSSTTFNLALAIELANAMKTNFNLHRTNVGSHVTDDSVNIVLSPDASDLDTLGVLSNELSTKFNSHRTQSGVHGSLVFIRLDPPDGVLYEHTQFFIDESGEKGVLYPFSDDETLHFNGGFEYTKDQNISYEGGKLPTNVQLVSAKYAPFTLLNTDSLSISVDNGPEDVVVFSTIDTTVQDVIDRINSYLCFARLNEIKLKLNTHLEQSGVHQTDDTVNTVLSPDATDIPTGIVLANEIKSKFNLHRTQSGVHQLNDTFNPVVLVDAFDLQSMVDLANDLRSKYELHRIQASVHVLNDSTNYIERTQSDVAVDNGDGRFRLTSPTSSSGSSLYVAPSTTRVKLGLDIPQIATWVLKSDNSNNVSVSIEALSPFALNMKTTGSGTRSIFRAKNGLTDSFFGFDFLISLKINNACIDSNGDSNIYVGLNSSSGPGISLGLGFDVDTVNGGLYVKVVDLNSGKNLIRKAFNWNDGAFHSYQLKKSSDQSMSLYILN